MERYKAENDLEDTERDTHNLKLYMFGLDMSLLQPYNLTAEAMFIVEDLNQDGIMTVAEIDAVFEKYDTN
ncbi:hypothetical protein MAR_034207, partial [Mya arenaria]